MNFEGDMPVVRAPANKSIGELLTIVIGTLVVLVFMVSSIGHGYVSLKLIPSLPFLSDEIAGVLLASGLALFNYLVFSILFGRWTRETASERFFLLVCAATVLALELTLTLAAIVKRNAADDYVIAAQQRLDSLMAAAGQVDQQMISGYIARLNALDERWQQAAVGNDVSREARCGEICLLAIVHRDKLQSAFLPLRQPIAADRPDDHGDLNVRMSRLQAVMRALAAKHALFQSFDRLVGQQDAEMQAALTKYVNSRALNAGPHPAATAYAALAAQVRHQHEEVFQGKDVITDQALLLRLTAETLLRCLTLRGAVSDYIAVTIALALVMLVPAFSVARKLWRSRDSDLQNLNLRDEIRRTRQGTDLLHELARARSDRGRAEMQATIIDDVWESLATAPAKRGQTGQTSIQPKGPGTYRAKGARC